MATHSHVQRKSGHSGPRRPGRKARERLERRRKAFDENRQQLGNGYKRPGSLKK